MPLTSNFNTLFKNPAQAYAPAEPSTTPVAKTNAEDVQGFAAPVASDQDLLALWDTIKKESFEARYVFERQWHRNILYILNRQWIEWNNRYGQWRDKRMASWIPRPVTNKCRESMLAIRAIFTSIRLGVNVRPNGSSPENVSAAAIADELSPVLHEDHAMTSVLNEFDFWLIVTGNAFLHTFVDYDVRHGTIPVAYQQCVACGTEVTVIEATCPTCGGVEFAPVLDESGQPKVEYRAKGKPMTIALSPLEVAFPNSYPRFSELPYIVRMRWRTKTYCESHDAYRPILEKISFQKSPNDQSLQLFKSIANHNDLGVSPAYWSEGSSQTIQEDGVPEYEVWMKPTATYPKGLVFRIIGDAKPIVVHNEAQEAIPGPLPYTDSEGNPVFTFTHAGYDHIGGRVLASGPIDAIIQKQDQLNQLDSMILLIIQRMSNPVWLEPKGAEVEKLTGMPGLVIKWNPLTVGGNAKPERISGEGPHQSLFQIRQQYENDIEQLIGTYDIVKGAKPTGIEAFSALQLLVERSQSRFASVFQARGEAYKDWFKFALELEREFGPEERTKAVMTPARTWTIQNFQRTQLQGSLSVIVEDGSTVPKTNLGMRAAIQQAASLGIVNPQDPDQNYEALKLFGLTRMAPTIDVHIQAALRKEQEFEEWLMDEMAVQTSMQAAQQEQEEYWAKQEAAMATTDPLTAGPTPNPPSLLAHTPLKWKKWYHAGIHRQEFMKWANSDRVRQLIAEKPGVEAMLEMHLMEIDAALAEEQMRLMGPPPPPAQGAGMAMTNSNRESTQGNEPTGTGEMAQRQGPA